MLIIVFILIFNLVFPIVSSAKENDDKIIYINSEKDLYNFATRVNNGENFEEYTVELKKDIELNCSELNQWTPIGTKDNPFKGKFNGNGYKISGMKIYKESKYVGGIVGYLACTDIKNTYNTGEIIVNAYNCATGGIVGSNHSTVKCSYNIGTIMGTKYVCGIVGNNFDRNTIIDCYNTGNITGNNFVGGIVGCNGSPSNIYCHGGSIKDCYSIGNIISSKDFKGNIAGLNRSEGKLNNCYYLKNGLNGYGINNSEEEQSVLEKEEAEMKTQSFVELLNNESTAYRLDSNSNNNGYPVLVWVKDIEINQMPNKLKYRQNIDDLDLIGGKVKLKYNYSEFDTIIDMNSNLIEEENFGSFL